MDKKLIENIIHDNSIEYSGYVIKHRSIADLRDGLN